MKLKVFVFGSNLAGNHAGGSAHYAHVKFDARMGVGEGRTGQAYALPTMDKDLWPRLLEDVDNSVQTFKSYACAHPELTFYVTRVGCGIAGFKDEQIAPMFKNSPPNCEYDPLWSAYCLPAWKEAM